MENAEPTNVERFLRSFRAAADKVAEGLTASRSAAADTHWTIWNDFCVAVALDPLLISYADPVPILNTFAQEYRDGTISASGKKVRSRTVEDAIRSIGQALSAMGAPDPRLNAEGKLDIRLRFQYRAYTKEDPPPNRVKPVLVQILRSIAGVAQASGNEELMAISDMIILAYFFLLRPGEYKGTKSPTTPFCLNNVSVSCGVTVFDLFTASEKDLLSSTYCFLEFTTQKNAV